MLNLVVCLPSQQRHVLLAQTSLVLLVAMISEISLKMIRCPETRQELVLADPQIVADINRQIATKQLQNRAGKHSNALSTVV